MHQLSSLSLNEYSHTSTYIYVYILVTKIIMLTPFSLMYPYLKMCMING